MKKIIVVFILCSFVSLLFANEASSDDLQLKINEYLKNSAKIIWSQQSENKKSRIY